jgi:hypothetical protein
VVMLWCCGVSCTRKASSWGVRWSVLSLLHILRSHKTACSNSWSSETHPVVHACLHCVLVYTCCFVFLGDSRHEQGV